MADRVPGLDDYLVCAACLDTFKELTTLDCNHSFCRSCLQKHWDQTKTRTCPVCRRKSSKELKDVNRALKDLRVSMKSECRAPVCSDHPAVPSLFCVDEAQAVCPVCEFSEHKEHTVVTLEQVETQLKQQLCTQLQTLLKHRREMQSLQQFYKDILLYSPKQAHVCETHIRAQFSLLHRFLHEEEELRLKALREEQSRQAQAVSSELGPIGKTLASVERSIQELQTQLQTTTDDFIHSYKPVQIHSQHPLPQPGPGLLLNQAKILGNLGYKVWKKMGKMVRFSPVILDPNTAHPKLSLSEDLTCVRRTDPPLELPENPERFCEGVLALGSEHLGRGMSCWDVEVGDHPHWAIGVVKETIKRKECDKCSTEDGFLYFRFHADKYFVDNKALTTKKRPDKIRVLVDYGGGTVSFYDLSGQCHIYTYRDTFTEKLHPFFYVGLSSANCQTKELRICPD